MTTVKDYTDLKIRTLFKNVLIILEDLADEYVSNMERLIQKLPEHERDIRQADFLTEEKLSLLRKKVLDAGNDCLRSIAPILSAIDSEIILKVKGNETKTDILVPNKC